MKKVVLNHTFFLSIEIIEKHFTVSNIQEPTSVFIGSVNERAN